MINGAHFHLLVNSVPIVGSFFAMALLCVAMLARNPDGWIRAGLLTFVIAFIGVVLAFLSGDPALAVISGAPRTSGHALQQHHVRALIATIIAAIAALIALVTQLHARKRQGSYARPWFLATLAAIVLTTASLAWTGLAGGRINHPELQEPADRERGPAHPH